MNLKLLDSEKAKVFGLPEQDTTEDELVTWIMENFGWTIDSAKKHLELAIASGVFGCLEKEIMDSDAVQVI